MTKTRIYTITPQQLLGFDKMEDGTLILPDTFELYIVPTAEDLKLERIAQLEAELANIAEPTQEELIESGKMMHPYYIIMNELTMLYNGYYI